jgi:CsoR family transcriptional regulator, copper-sensing transcriptional repressor
VREAHAVQAQKKDVLKRLAYIEGHLKGIRKMVEDDQYCVDILKQTYAVKRAIDKLEGVLLSGHLDGCVREGFHDGRDEEMIGELGELFELSRR